MIENSTDLSLNDTLTEKQFRDEPSFSQAGSAMLGSCTVLGNIITLVAILTQRETMTRAFTSIANLAVADYFSGCVMLGFTGILSDKSIVQSDVLCSLTYALMVFATGVSANALLFVTTDRYLIIVWPLSYLRITSFPKYEILIALGWILAFLFASLPVLNIFGRLHLTDICSFGGIFTPGYISFIFSTTYVIPLVVMLLMYVKIATIARKHRKQISSLQVTISSSSQERIAEGVFSVQSESSRRVVSDGKTLIEQKARSKEQWKASKTIFIVLGYFIFSWLPFYSCMLLAPIINTSAG